MFTLKQELKTQSPMDSPHRPSERGSAKKAKKSPSKLMRLSDGRSVEIVNDSSNDAFTYLCTHPEPPPQPQSNTTPSLQTAVKAEEATTEAKTETTTEEAKTTETTTEESKTETTTEESKKETTTEESKKETTTEESKTESKTEAEEAKDEKSRKSRKRGRAPSVRQEAEDPSGFDRGRGEAW